MEGRFNGEHQEEIEFDEILLQQIIQETNRALGTDVPEVIPITVAFKYYDEPFDLTFNVTLKSDEVELVLVSNESSIKNKVRGRLESLFPGLFRIGRQAVKNGLIITFNKSELNITTVDEVKQALELMLKK